MKGDNWPKVPLVEISTKIGSGATPRGGGSSYKSSGISLIRSLNVYDFRFEIDGLAFIDEKQASGLSNVVVEQNDILLNITGASVARCCIVPQRVLPARVNQHVSIVRINPNCADAHFVLNVINSPRYKNQLLTIAQGGATREALTKEKIENFIIPLPPLSTQRKIAAILSAYDDLIENNTRRIQILEEIANAIYREWFVHFRFPRHENVKMVDSGTELGDVPEGWDVTTLGEACHLVMGQSPKSEYYNEEGVGLPFHQGVKDFGNRYPIDRVYCTLEKRLANKNDILFSVRAPVGRMNVADKKIVIGRGLSSIRHRDNSNWFTFHQLREKFFQEDMIGGGTIFKSVTKQDMQNIQLLFPVRELLEHFEAVIGDIAQQIYIITQKNHNLRSTRDLLLPRLVSGNVDISELNISTDNI